MQFPKFVIALGFISASLSSPVAIESRQQTLPQAIDSITKTLTTGVNANLLTLQGLVKNIKKNVNASAAVVASVEANLDSIRDSFRTAASSLIASTNATTKSNKDVLKTFTASQISDLADDVRSIIAITRQFQSVAESISANLSPAAVNAVKDELTAAQNAISPFVTPLRSLANAVENANTSAVYGLRQASTSLTGVVTAIAQRLAQLLGVKGVLGL